MDIWILDDSLRISIYYEKEDCRFIDNICISVYESCPENEKILIADETNLFLTPEQALTLSEALQAAAINSKNNEKNGAGGEFHN